ncbi:sugar phosphate isomerase/epimerase [Oceanispirochaeta sp.]|jgi:sugar phosphate isomerase/epimerase|uniref:sugar phosphate isomerase/epimerase family protein n=1 Tax=Oceanispirochaeta sp. TaxID=2035350 RepID=UPI002613C84E|nr:sugar phosphate isomerase/epimerase family protein [Oceanispirochaeta sp.]MDA3957051.1 sugar phosphate isomerase/epimerase [Oceanispirochaeta sp.]
MKELTNLDRLCVHTITTKPWSIEESIEQYARAGVKGITIWRDTLENRDRRLIRKKIKDAGLEVVSICRGGFFPKATAGERERAIDDNLALIDEAAEVGAPHIVLVCGAEPTISLAQSRHQIMEGISRINSYARDKGVKLAIEPLHPMYADSRSAVNTMEQANDMWEQLNSKNIGIAVDIYHLWWDPHLQDEIKRAGAADSIMAFHTCDWKNPTTDFLLDRGLMGEGIAPIMEIRSWVEDAGFKGFIEVEIFSEYHWKKDQKIFLNEVINAYRQFA